MGPDRPSRGGEARRGFAQAEDPVRDRPAFEVGPEKRRGDAFRGRVGQKVPEDGRQSHALKKRVPHAFTFFYMPESSPPGSFRG